VDYAKWSADYGHDNLTVTSSGAVAMGNEFAATAGVMLRAFSGAVNLVVLGSMLNGGGAAVTAAVTATVSAAALTGVATEVAAAGAGAGVTAMVPRVALASVSVTTAGTYTASVSSAAGEAGVDPVVLPPFNFTVAAGAMAGTRTHCPPRHGHAL